MSRLRTAWIFIYLPFPCEISLATQRNSKKSTVPESSMSTSNMASCKQKLIVCSFYKLWILPTTISRQSPSKNINHATHTKEFF